MSNSSVPMSEKDHQIENTHISISQVPISKKANFFEIKMLRGYLFIYCL